MGRPERRTRKTKTVKIIYTHIQCFINIDGLLQIPGSLFCQHQRRRFAYNQVNWRPEEKSEYRMPCAILKYIQCWCRWLWQLGGRTILSSMRRNGGRWARWARWGPQTQGLCGNRTCAGLLMLPISFSVGQSFCAQQTRIIPLGFRFCDQYVVEMEYPFGILLGCPVKKVTEWNQREYYKEWVGQLIIIRGY